MPDWFYRTVSQRLLFKLSATTARDLALGFMGRLARLPLGGAMIDFMGHMAADARLRCTYAGVEFPTAVGLGPHLDANAMALPALARFGVGFIEIGPITVHGCAGPPIERRVEQEAIWLPDPPASLGLAEVKPRVVEAFGLGLPVIARLGMQSTDDCVKVIRELGPHVHFFSWQAFPAAAAEWPAMVEVVIDAAREARRPMLWCVPAGAEPSSVAEFVDAALHGGVNGILIDGSVRAETGGQLIGAPARWPAMTHVRHLRERHGPDLFLVASGGVHEPEQALDLRRAGADLVQVDSGLIYSGPGLPKRINDALLFEATRESSSPMPDRLGAMSWFWTLLMGAGMLFGSGLALAIAATRVVLPYDEEYLRLSRDEIAQINPRLLDFMAHDRVSLAGTMIAIGVMYVGLSLFGSRRGLHWAQLSVFVSAFTGFATFFSFLGFGYLDPFHAFVTVALLQLLLLGVHAKLGTHVPEVAPALRGDAAWRRGLWGQLLMIIHGCGLLGAGAVISCIGVTHVFVHEDLDFMQTTAERLQAVPRLVPLVAHDRATFGGMLLASGWVFLLPALWGYRNGSAWLWWTMLLAGLPAYVAAIGVHYAVGYTHIVHLLPAFSGLVIFSAGMALSYSFMCKRE